LIKGFNGKILLIDLFNRTFKEEILSEDKIIKFLGGRGLAAEYYRQLIGKDIDPLSDENKLIFMTGILTGTRVPSSTKFNCATKSPETGHYLCSNSGGLFGPYLKKAGYDGLIIEGKGEKPLYLIVNNGRVTFIDAENYWGLKVSDFESEIKKTSDIKNPSIMSIGPGAENGVVFASIQVDGRSFGRAGAGAVMGSKLLKGIVTYGSKEIPVANMEKIKTKFKELSKKVRESKISMTKYGTLQNLELANIFGCLPTRNFQDGVFENASKIDAETMKKNYFTKNGACYNCPIACEQNCEVKEGKYKGTKIDPEYETVGLLGANCGISNFAAIMKANKLCDDYSLDTMSTGGIIALAMELYERGIIDNSDSEGIQLNFGNDDALIEVIHKIAKKEGIGAILSQGMRGIIKAIPEAKKYAVHVKGLPLAAYDPRGVHGMSLTYGTSSRGACHNVGGYTISTELDSNKYDRFAFKGKGKLVKKLQDVRAYLDSTGVCTQARTVLGFTDNPEEVVLKDITGYDFSSTLMEIGARIYSLERMILVREGITRKDDYLPPRMEEPLGGKGASAGHAISKKNYDLMLDEYYREREWDENGIPTTKCLSNLKINQL